MWTRDKAYTDLMRELWGSPDVWNSKKSYTKIAERLRVDEETVRNRIRHLRESGFLLGYRLLPNPSLLGRSFGSIRIEFRDRESKKSAIPRLGEVEGAINIASTFDNSVLVTLMAGDIRDPSNLTAGLGIEGEVSWVPPVGLRTTSFRMTSLDWEIVSLLLRDAETRLDEVAEQLRVSTRTVKRRLNAMMEGTAVFTMPVVDLSKMEGVSYQLRIQTEQGKSSQVEKTVTARIGNVVFLAADSQNGSVFGFNGANIAEGNEILEWARIQPGVRSATMAIVEQVVQVFSWLEGEVAKRLREQQVQADNPSGKILEQIAPRQPN